MTCTRPVARIIRTAASSHNANRLSGRSVDDLNRLVEECDRDIGLLDHAGELEVSQGLGHQACSQGVEFSPPGW
ncbi:hypothetical protein BN970_02934 [Mycolicibacterium conceptionense]|uniref:Uncharacterized protein n=1 Tax=Mycolicibacterium conceptionense TaxID=451644 RepID=A0A0U1DHB0_9MYCO|nr:hypothetical protein BN970_02934 [Mycolicibacterium conceptionense]